MTIASLSQSSVALPSATRPIIAPTAPFDTLRQQLAGELILPDSPHYDDARKVSDVTVDRRPLAIVRASTAADVAAAVTFARRTGYPLAVRSGGHSVAYLSMIDGAVVIDLSRMTGVSVDPATRTARVQAGATSGNVARPAHGHGLALTTGDTASVGIGGLATGGGIGFMVRKYGLTIDHLLSAEVVTANGAIVTASPTEHADLFWAIRGGGGNVGIVTEFTFRLERVDQVLGGMLLLPANRAVLRGYLDYSVAAPDDLTTIANLMHAPPAPFVPADRVGEMVLAILVTWTGSIEDGQRALAPLRALAEPMADLVQPMPYPAMYDFTAHQAAPHAASLRSMFAGDISDESLDAALAAMAHASSPYSIVQFRGLGGAMARVPGDATAFAHRQSRYLVAAIALWLDAAENAAPHQAWTNRLWQAMRRDADGVYVNFLEAEGAERVRDAYPAATFARLAAIKQQYDPTNLFRFNQNIPPRA